MLVKELIAQLQAFDQDHEVLISDDNDCGCVYAPASVQAVELGDKGVVICSYLISHGEALRFDVK